MESERLTGKVKRLVSYSWRNRVTLRVLLLRFFGPSATTGQLEEDLCGLSYSSVYVCMSGCACTRGSVCVSISNQIHLRGSGKQLQLISKDTQSDAKLIRRDGSD